MDSGLFGLHLKSTCKGELFIVPKKVADTGRVSALQFFQASEYVIQELPSI